MINQFRIETDYKNSLFSIEKNNDFYAQKKQFQADIFKTVPRLLHTT